MGEANRRQRDGWRRAPRLDGDAKAAGQRQRDIEGVDEDDRSAVRVARHRVEGGEGVVEAAAGHAESDGYRAAGRIEGLFEIGRFLLCDATQLGSGIPVRRALERIEIADDGFRHETGIGDDVAAAIRADEMSPAGCEIAQQGGVDFAAADDHQHAIEGERGPVLDWVLQEKRPQNRFSASRWGAPETELRVTH